MLKFIGIPGSFMKVRISDKFYEKWKNSLKLTRHVFNGLYGEFVNYYLPNTENKEIIKQMAHELYDYDILRKFILEENNEKR